MKPYYYVYRPGTKGPTVRHATLTEAEAEAARLAKAQPGDTFEILQCLGLTSTPKPSPRTFWLDDCPPDKTQPEPPAAPQSQHFTCTDWHCGWSGPADAILRADDPFNPGCEMIGCPDCREQTLQVCCDEPGCNQPADTGTPTTTGYRSTCAHHAPQESR